MIKAVIFDLDGVIVSTDDAHYLAWKRLASELEIEGFNKADNLRQRGVSRMESLEIVLEKTNRRFSSNEKISLADLKNRYYVESLKTLNADDILPNVRETIVALRKKGVKLAVGSSSKNATFILKRIELIDLFDAIADGNDISLSKPDPQVFIVAAEKLHVDATSCLVIEDADAGIDAGYAARMKTIGLGPAAQNPKADYHARDLADRTLDWNRILR
jgi:beta-phosphoglucomutase